MESPLHGYSPMRQFASASNIHSPTPDGGQSHSHHDGAPSGLTLTPTHSRLTSSPRHGADGKQQQHGGSATAAARRYHPNSPLPPRTPSNNKQRPGNNKQRPGYINRPAKSLDCATDAAEIIQQQQSPSESSVSKYYRREDRLAAPGDNEQSTDTMYQKAKLGQQLRDCDTLTTAQETMSNQHSLYASLSLSASASGSNPAANTGTSSAKNGARQGHHHHHQPILISTHHHAEQYQGIEIFSPQVRSERPSRCYDDEVGEDDTISDASSISTAMSTLAHDDPLQRQVKITGIQRAIRKNYEIIQASSSESTDDDGDDSAMQSMAKSLMDVAGTFSADSDEDDEYRMLDKMSDQTKMFQEWLTMGLGGLGGGGGDRNGDTGSKDLAKASWMWKPAPLDIPATLERQSDGRGGLLNSLGANSSLRSLISRGLVPEESAKTMMAEHNRGIEQKHFRQHSNSAEEFLQSAEKLEQRARRREEEERVRSDREGDDAADGGMRSILRMMGESFFKCTGY